MRPGPIRPRARHVAVALALAALAACGSPAPGSGTPEVGPIPVDGGTPVPAPAATAPAPPPSCVQQTVDRLGDRRYGQLVVGGMPAGAPSSAALAAVRAGSGGVILVDGDTASVRAVAATVTGAQQAADVPLLVSTDQEGGQVQKLSGPGFSSVPAPTQQPQDPDALRRAAVGWGGELAAARVNLDLAPVADVVDPALGTANAPVGKYGRQYGTSPSATGPRVAAFVQGLDAAGVASTLKHFPGLGRVRQNTDFAGGVVDTATGPDDPALQSFADGIAAGAPVVMMSSARYPRIDPDHLALYSPTVMNDVLRGRLGFRGVIMTDDVGVAVALADIPVAQRATRFVEAGGDVTLTVRPGDVAPMIAALRDRAAADPAFAARADDAVRRVLTLKQERGLLRCG